MSDYLFVYGLLRKDAPSQMSKLLARKAEYVSPATFQGKMYLVETYPGTVPSENPADCVKGEVHKIKNASLLETLDEFEGIDEEFPTPYEYRREIVEVELEDQSKVSAWMYVYNWEVDESTRIDSGDFFQTIE